MKILVTGGAGFVGSNLASGLKKNYPSYEIFVIDNLKRRGSELNLTGFKEKGINFFHGDVRNREDFDQLPVVDFIIDASAEPSILAGLDENPEYLVNTNLSGTFNCLNFAKKAGASVIFLSTSRVYPVEKLCSINYIEDETRFQISDNQKLPGVSSLGVAENFPLSGYRSFYGMTKLASELALEEYREFYQVNYVINRCGIIAGPGQLGKVDQGIAVYWVAAHYWQRPLKYLGFKGKGIQVRDMLHIQDLYNLIDRQIHKFHNFSGKLFNVGGGLNSSASLVDLTQICREITGNRTEIFQTGEIRKADIPIYISDNTKICSYSGWKPERDIKDIVQDIFKWLKEDKRLKEILN
jgi:CDP-paratose 2-epimerase